MTKTYDFWKKNKIDKLRLGNEVDLGEIKVALSMCQIISEKRLIEASIINFIFNGIWFLGYAKLKF